ncbi:c-type cytochrome biogenesis protein CcsB [Pseudoclavibacter chungangensis]|uniref:C-type cytochrome biogenesis protein CcsB n=1 Tax=Pseudoclavibacter chungangensis TaxID=587635 RepID=A0A7J5BSB0_9MICO|nr:c-type cytochrome biogenesis protein CcsB [Pseudoclavibacter chungangensis]KAB1655695.1 c-type cytochrome biogenesis protein CcsB [Pseudoclavibacter chungangensis]
MAAYAISFIFFAMDLAGRSARIGAPRAAGSAVGATKRTLVGARATAGTASDGHATGADIPDPTADADATTATGRKLASTRATVEDGWRDTRATPSLRIAMWIMGLGFAVHLAAAILRGIAAGRVPWSNMYEFSMTFTLLIVLVFFAVQFWTDVRFLGTFITGFAVLWLNLTTLGFYVDVVPLAPALQSAWLVIHVFIASLATGCLALGFGLSVFQLLQTRRAANARAGRVSKIRFLQALPDTDRLENLAYRINVVGFILWTFTLICGAIWAEQAWGRYWGWDTKEVWTFIIWVVYAGYIHARATRGWRGTPSAWLSIVGFLTVLFNFGIVNVFFKGLHAYSGL